jgi:uncharacterized protein (DUF1800 family)
MDRREFLTAKRKPIVSQPLTVSTFQPSVAGLNPYTGNFGTGELVHLLKRTMFGAAKADIEYFKSKSLPAIVDELLHPVAPLPLPPVKEYDPTGAAVPDTNIAAGTTWVNDPNTDGTIVSRRTASFKKWWTGLMINQDRSIREKMTLFWHNHFSTETVTVGNSQYIYKHHNLLRTNCLGNFQSLVKAVTTDPAMLVYLSGNGSTVSSPNENYGRELQELFTIGKENSPNYSEDDVKAAARTLTGWKVTASTIASSFDVTKHDKTNKVFSSFYNNTIITGRSTSTAGDQEIGDLLTMIFNKKNEVSRFIIKKLYRWFCYYNIDADTDANIITPLAQLLQLNNWNIVPVLFTLFNSEHFFDSRNRGCLIKSPADMAVGMCREFNMVFPDASNYTVAYAMYDNVRNYFFNMGQNIGDPPNVAGWPAYYQEPQFHELWLSTDTLPKRNKYSDYFIANGYTIAGGGANIRIDPVLFAKSLSNTGDPNALLNDSLDILFTVPLSDVSKAAIKKQTLLSGQENDQYWTDAWIAYLANPAITGAAYNTVLSRLRALYKYLMELAEYQLS